MRTIRTIGATITAGVLSSFLFMGVGGRAALKVIGFFSGRGLHFTIEGTIATLVICTSLGVVGGLLFALFHRYIQGSPSRKGGSFGLLLFVVLIPMRLRTGITTSLLRLEIDRTVRDSHKALFARMD